jgi:hypothetical protein
MDQSSGWSGDRSSSAKPAVLCSNCPWKKPSMAFFHLGDTPKSRGFWGSPIAASCGGRLFPQPAKKEMQWISRGRDAPRNTNGKRQQRGHRRTCPDPRIRAGRDTRTPQASESRRLRISGQRANGRVRVKAPQLLASAQPPLPPRGRRATPCLHDDRTRSGALLSREVPATDSTPLIEKIRGRCERAMSWG